jgi:hypothetical protein
MASLNPNQSLPRGNESAEADDPAQLVRSVSMQLGLELLDSDCNWQRRCNNVVVDSKAPKGKLKFFTHNQDCLFVFRSHVFSHNFSPSFRPSFRFLLQTW